MEVEFPLGEDFIEINELARILTQAITGREKDEDEQKRIRSLIVYAKKTGAIKEGKLKAPKNHVNGSEAFHWVRTHKKLKKHRPKIEKIKNIPARRIESTGASFLYAQPSTIAGEGVVIPGDIDQLKVEFCACHSELRKAKSQIKDLKEKEKELLELRADKKKKIKINRENAAKGKRVPKSYK